MSTASVSATASAALTGQSRPAYRVTGLRVLRSEWAKFWSLRSSWITLGVALFLLVAIGAISAGTYSPDAASSPGPGGPGGEADDAVSLALLGATFASLAIGVLGVLASAGEYTTGMIRSTMTAVPTRLPVLWSKSLAYGVVAFAVATAGVFAAFLLGVPLLDGQDIALSLGDDGVVRSLVGAGLYLGLVGVLGVALGALVRSSAGGIAILTGALLIVPGLTTMLPDSWEDAIGPYLPSNAGGAVMELHQSADSLAPWAGLAVFAGWVVVVLAGAAYRLRRTDV